ncbi:hypothetical protein BJX76DRAFT_348667 [Aspergillus varians]
MCADSNTSAYLLQAQQLLRRVPLIDGHNDFPFMIRGLYLNKLDNGNLHNLPIGQTDIARLRRGMVGGQFWSAYVPNPKQSEPPSDELELECLRQTLQQVDVIHRMVSQYPNVLGLTESVADVWNVFRSGRIASLIAIEGLHQIAHSPSVLRMLHRFGVRYTTLSHTKSNRYCDSATTSRIIDLSHTSEVAQKDVLEISKAPVIFSHSACFGLVPHPRNATDETLQLLKKNGGVIMICFLRDLVDPSGGRNATRAQVVDHILYAAEKIGYEHVGIGSDFDGMLEGPEGLDDVSQFPDLVVGLLRRGVTESQIEQIVGLNVLRVMGEVENVALQEQRSASTRVFCDEIGSMWTPEQCEMLDGQGRKRGLEAGQG